MTERPIMLEYNRHQGLVDETGQEDEKDLAQDSVQADDGKLTEEMLVVNLVADMDQDRQSEIHQRVGGQIVIQYISVSILK